MAIIMPRAREDVRKLQQTGAITGGPQAVGGFQAKMSRSLVITRRPLWGECS
ncbi:MAG TPA: hypothetical protein VF762_24190 [Blastocatellia bacterium]|jgi:hypothetical protein